MTTDDVDQIRDLLGAYETSLNRSDAAAAAALYAADGMFYPYNLPTAAGHDQLLAAYEQTFATIRLDISFTVHDELVDGDLAFATTGSKGEVTVLAENVTVPEENRELFVFARASGQWKIARYMFNKSAVPAA